MMHDDTSKEDLNKEDQSNKLFTFFVVVFPKRKKIVLRVIDFETL